MSDEETKFSVVFPGSFDLQQFAEQAKKANESIELEKVLDVRRVAYRENKNSPWQWRGNAIKFTLEGHYDQWISSHMQINNICKELALRFNTIEEYVDNVKIIRAPSEEALELVDPNEK